MSRKVGRGEKFVWSKKRGRASRPWRLWGAHADKTGGNILYRAFGDEVRAHNAALIDVRWGEFKSIQVYDVRNGKESGTYYFHANGNISFTAPADSRIVKLLKEKGVV